MFSAATKAMKRLFRNGSRRKRERSEYKRQLRTEPLEPRQLLAQTVGVTVNEPEAFDGYTLFAPTSSTMTHLIDNEGQEINSWESKFQPMSAYLMEEIPGTNVKDGDLLRAGRKVNVDFGAPGTSGVIELFSWEGKRKWIYTYSNKNVQMHHDIEMLPNGNILAMAWENRSRASAIAQGRDPALLPEGNNFWPEKIIEIKPNYDKGRGGQIVWAWRLWDHLVQDEYPGKPNYVADVASRPDRMDINWESAGERGAAGNPEDWVHWNGIDYNADLDQIAISLRDTSEFWLIDHSTTTGQAKGSAGGNAGKGGDLLYRWGNARVYDDSTYDVGDQQMFYQHTAQWVPGGYPGAGNITVFDNGGGRVEWNDDTGEYEYIPRGQEYSTAIEVAPEMLPDGYNYDWTKVGEDVLEWKYVADPPTDFLSFIISSVERLPNGNMLIDEGTQGRYFEVTLGAAGDGSDSEIVWEYIDPVTGAGPLHQGDVIPPSGGFPGTLDNWTFRAYKYATDDPLFAGKDLTPKSRLEYDPADSPGLYVPGQNTWYLNDRIDGSIKELTTVDLADVPLRRQPIAGDWDGDGVDSIGLYDPRTGDWYLNNKIDGSEDSVVTIDADRIAGAKPVAGDWDGDGIDTPGLYDPNTSTWYLGGNNPDDPDDGLITVPEVKSRPKGWRPIAGDFDGDGIDTIGFYAPGNNAWLFHHDLDGQLNAHAKGPKHDSSWWQPIAGDWNGDGTDSIGLHDNRTNTWYLNNDIDGSIDDLYVVNGPTDASRSWKPIVGDWDNSGPPPPPALMLAADLAQLAGVAQTLTQQQLTPVLDAALRQAGVSLSDLSVQIVDLPGLQLGRAIGDSLIQIDINAAGAGWHTGLDAPVRGVDLQTAISHEIGHVLGRGHSDDGVMDDTLEAGTRSLWDNEVDAVFAG